MLNVILFYGRDLSCYVIICIIYFYFYFFGGHKAFFKSKCKAQVRPFCIVLEPIFRAKYSKPATKTGHEVRLVAVFLTCYAEAQFKQFMPSLHGHISSSCYHRLCAYSSAQNLSTSRSNS